jgi:PAS domain S-box-containing protein
MSENSEHIPGSGAEELLALIQQVGHSGIFEWHVPSGRFLASPQFLSIYGLSEFDGCYETWLKCVFREDIPRVTKLIEKAFAERARESQVEFRIVRLSDGNLAWIEGRSINLYGEDGRPLRIVGTHVDITERKRALMQLRTFTETLEEAVRARTAELADANTRLLAEIEEREKAESRFRLLVEGVTEYALYLIDPEGKVTNWNTGAQRIKGYTAAEIVGHHYSRFFSEEDRSAGVPQRALRTAAELGRFETEGWRVRKDGSQFWASAVLSAIRDKDGTLIGFAKLTRDVTERREAEIALQKTQEQLAQAQKMEGIGQLTGGVAHDFNYLLTVMIGNLEALQRATANGASETARLSSFVENALRSAHRAAELIQRLLAFSRRQPLDPKPIEVSRLVAGMSELLRRTIGESIAVETVLAGGLWSTHVDPNQLEIAIVNLAVNARDAMPSGGKLTIETGNIYLDQEYATVQTEVVPGQYVMICVTDTGTGMPKEVLELAGLRINIHMAAALLHEPVHLGQPQPGALPNVLGREEGFEYPYVLVTQLRALYPRLLLVTQLRALYPRLPILIASGYAEAELRNHFRNDLKIAFVGKPYTQQQLVDAVRLLAK